MFGRKPSVLGVALGGALVLWTTSASADQFNPSLSIQTGMTFTRQPGNSTDDYFVAATPAISYTIEGDRVALALSYSFTGSLNTVLPNGIANRAAAQLAYDWDPRTRLLFGVEGLQALIGNYLLVRRAAETQIGQLPPLNTSLLTLSANQGVTHDITPVDRFTQTLTGTYVTSLDPDVRLNNYLATATFQLDHAWEFDALGGAIDLQYARTFFPPIESNAGTAAIGPTWDHDFTTTISSSAAVQGQMAFSPDPNTDIRLAPSGRAAIGYNSEGNSIGIDYVGGITPNLLLGTLLQSHTVTLRGATPLSRSANVVVGASMGYLRAKTLDLQNDGLGDNEFDAVLHDADITWGPSDFFQIFVRYQFIGQSRGTGPGAIPPLVRHGAILGIELFGTKPINRRKVQNKFPQRVDRGDAAPGGGIESESQ